MKSLRVVIAVLVAGVGAGVSPLPSAAVVTPVVVAAPAPVLGGVAPGSGAPRAGSSAAAAPSGRRPPVIEGVVRAADTGRPLVWVAVGATSLVDPRDHHTTLTDDDGRYRIEGVRRGGEYTVAFEPRKPYLGEFAPGTASPYRAGRYKAPARVDATLDKGVPISGRVTSPTGGGVDDANVVVWPVDSAGDGGRGQSRETGEGGESCCGRHGAWSVWVRPGRYRVSSMRPDYSSAGFHPSGRSAPDAAILRVGSGGRTGVDVVQLAPGRLEVTVIDASTGRPLVDETGRVWVRPVYSRGEPPHGAGAGTDPGAMSTNFDNGNERLAAVDGAYSVPVEPGAPVAVEVGGPDTHARAISTPVRVAAGRTAKVRVTVNRAGTLAGTTVDRITGKLARTCVEAEAAVFPPRRFTTCTGDDGRWTLTGLPAGLVKVRVHDSRFHVAAYAPAVAGTPAARDAAAAGLFEVRAGATTAVPPIRLERGGWITGRVLDQRGRAVAGAGVRIAASAWWQPPQHSTTTDATGRYRLVNLSPGPHRVQVLPPSYTGLGSAWVGGAADAAHSRGVVVRAGRTTSLPAQRLPAGATLSVVLGAIDDSVVVEALDPQGRIVGQAPARLPLRTGKAGRTVTLTGLPATAVRVHAFSTRTDPIRHSWLGGGRSFTTTTPVRLTAGRTATVSLRAPAAATRDVAGIVTVTESDGLEVTGFGGIGGVTRSQAPGCAAMRHDRMVYAEYSGETASPDPDISALTDDVTSAGRLVGVCSVPGRFGANPSPPSRPSVPGQARAV